MKKKTVIKEKELEPVKPVATPVEKARTVKEKAKTAKALLDKINKGSL